MMNIEHPEIGWAMRTGYPSWNQPIEESVHCGECGKDITYKDKYTDECHKYLCKECLLYFHIIDE